MMRKSTVADVQDAFNKDLIKLVERCPHLHDLADRKYKDQAHRSNTFSAIATKLKRPVAEVTARWKSLRDQFVRAMGKLKKPLPSGCSAMEMHMSGMTFLYADSMKFLIQHVHSRRTIRNVADVSEENPCPSDDTDFMELERVLALSRDTYNKECTTDDFATPSTSQSYDLGEISYEDFGKISGDSSSDVINVEEDVSKINSAAITAPEKINDDNKKASNAMPATSSERKNFSFFSELKLAPNPKKRTKTDKLDETMQATLQKMSSYYDRKENTQPVEESKKDDPDFNFSMTVFGLLKNLPKKRKKEARLQILKVLNDLEDDENDL